MGIPTRTGLKSRGFFIEFWPHKPGRYFPPTIYADWPQYYRQEYTFREMKRYALGFEMWFRRRRISIEFKVERINEQ
jgi:hypothetical protein